MAERVAGAASTTAPPEGARQLDERVWRSFLPGGTEILTERMESIGSAAIGFWFRHGAAHEPAGLGGCSHLLEHLVFKGTPSRSARQIATEIEGVGGAIDAFTTHEYTSFQVRVPATHVPRALDVLTDLAFRPLLRAEDLELERQVILEEIARVEDTPDELAFDLHADFLYEGHPYGAPILGTRETIQELSAEKLHDLHKSAYDPSNLVVAVTGDVMHGHVVELLGNLLPDASGGGSRTIEPPARLASGERRTRRPGGSQVHIVAGCPGIPFAHPLRHAVILVSSALGGGMSSRLFQRIREEEGLAYSVFSFHAFHQLAGHVGSYVGTGKNTAARAKRRLESELRSIAESGLEADEVAMTRELLKGQLMLTLEAASARMHRLATVALYGEPYRSIEEVTRLLDEVTAEELAVACSLYHPDRLAVLELWPA